MLDLFQGAASSARMHEVQHVILLELHRAVEVKLKQVSSEMRKRSVHRTSPIREEHPDAKKVLLSDGRMRIPY